MIEVGKYNRENTNVDFDSDLVVEGVVLETTQVKNLDIHIQNCPWGR